MQLCPKCRHKIHFLMEILIFIYVVMERKIQILSIFVSLLSITTKTCILFNNKNHKENHWANVVCTLNPKVNGKMPVLCSDIKTVLPILLKKVSFYVNSIDFWILTWRNRTVLSILSSIFWISIPLLMSWWLNN